MTEQQTISEWLSDRLDEDERWARLASKPPNGIDPEPSGGVHWDWAVGPNLDPLEIPDPSSKRADGMLTKFGTLAFLVTAEKFRHAEGVEPAVCSYSEGIHDMEGSAASHIVRHDPARALREVAAKRAIIAAHPIDDRGYCKNCWADRTPQSAEAPCLTLRNLAAVYPDCPEKWKP